jgi:hypothetical protein
METTHVCPNCKVTMVVGFIPDHYAQTVRSHWHPGAGTEKTFLGNLKIDNALMVPIAAYRCPECGLLTQFANK